MNQHFYQEARLKPFEDKSLNQVWVYPKSGTPKFPQSAGELASAEDFQSPELEAFQQETEAKAGRAFQHDGPWNGRERDSVVEWVALHIIRTRKGLIELFESPDEYNRTFFDEFEKEVIITRKLNIYPSITARDGRFFVTGDQPVVELRGSLENMEIARFFAKSPAILVALGAQGDMPAFELPVEDYFNAMVLANAGKFVYSHRKDLDLAKLKHIANDYDMHPFTEAIEFEGKFTADDDAHLRTLRTRRAKRASP